MRMRGIRFNNCYFAIFAALLAVAAPVAAQPAVPGFRFAFQSAGGPAVVLADGDTISFPVTPVGSSSAVTLVISSTFNSAWTVTRSTTSGTGFATLGGTIPVPANSAASFLVSSTPPSVGSFSGRLSITLSNAAGESRDFSFALSSTGLSGVLLSYTLNSGNQTLLAEVGSISFPVTPINTAANALFSVSNRTSAPVTLNSVLVSGAQFRTVGLPLLPLQIAAGQEVRFTVAFTPEAATVASGTLLLTIGGSVTSIGLSGLGAGPVLSYELGVDSTFITIAPGTPISFPDADANSGQSTVTMRIQNSGNLAGQIPAIASSSVNFQLLDLPGFPATIAPGANLSIRIRFAPRSAGRLTGTLSIGTAVFPMTGIALGSSFSVTLVTTSQRTPIPVGGSATLPNTAIGSRQPFVLEIANVGNLEGALTSLRLLGGGFSLTRAPSLPVTLAAGGSIQLEAVFAPSITGIVNGSVIVENQGYGLIVTATPPPPLPEFTFTNVSPRMSPLVQPAFGMQLGAPYPYDLEGVLTISFDSKELGDDPNVQFISGARFVSFRIPANSTRAVFRNGAQTAPFQTGSIAGTITLSVTLSVGTYNMTADAPLAYNITIPPAAPVIYSVELLSQSTTGVNLIIKGYTTARSVQKISLEFAPNIGAILQTTALSANVEDTFKTWFRSSAGQSFGSQFALTLRLNVAGSVAAIKSVTVSASNEEGSSAPSTLALN